ncbi:Vigilin-like 42, partial [Homarus americanus]
MKVNQERSRPLPPSMSRMRAQWVEETVSETVKADNCLFGVIIGPGGSTIKELQVKYNIRVLVPRKGSKDEPITVQGKDKTLVKNAVLRIKALIAEEKERRRVTTPVSQTLCIPKALHGKVIGLQGQNIRPITQALKIKIQFPNKNDNKRRQVMKVNQERSRPLPPSMSRMRAQWVEETVSETVKADNCLFGVIIGPGGSTIKELQVKYNIRVLVPRKGSKDEPITVQGKDKTLVKNAVLRIKALIAEEKERRRVTTPVSQTLCIPKALHGKVIGLQGQNIRPITQALKIKIQFPNKNDNSDEVTLTGLPDQVDQGISRLLNLETVSETVKADNCLFGVIIGPGGSTIKELQVKYNIRVLVPRKGSKDEPITVQGKDKTLVKNAVLRIKALIAEEKERRRVTTPVSQTLCIPKALHGKVIGLQGQNIRPITQALKIKIQFPNKNDNSDEVTLTGLPDQVDQGISRLLNLVTRFPPCRG